MYQMIHKINVALACQRDTQAGKVHSGCQA